MPPETNRMACSRNGDGGELECLRRQVQTLKVELCDTNIGRFSMKTSVVGTLGALPLSVS